jgi:thioredoxin reductase
MLLATGVVDQLPEIPGLKEMYGRSVHHCPYCDGWEHRGQHLAALGDGDSAAGLALSLRSWSPHITALTNGAAISAEKRKQLDASQIACRQEKISRLVAEQETLAEVLFDTGPPLRCDALFFSADKAQRSPLPEMLGCKCDDSGLIKTGKKHCTDIDGLFLAGDADGDVQFAIVAAAEGATAATAINRALQDSERS